MMARTGRQLGKAQRLQFASDRRLVQGDAERLEDPGREILAPPPHHTVDRRDRAALHHPGQGLTLLVAELRPATRRPAGHKPVRTPRVEPHHPIPHNLKCDAADQRRLSPRSAIVDPRQG
jgi:hypothetical protein